MTKFFFRFLTILESNFMPCSGFTGANLKERVDPKLCPWYSGPSLLEFLDELRGIVNKGDSFVLMPNKQTVKVMAITGSDEKEKNSSSAGENVKLKLAGIEEDDVLPGFVVCHPTDMCNTGTVFDAQIVILEHKSIICAGYTAVLHIHNAVEEVKLVVSLLFCINTLSGNGF